MKINIIKKHSAYPLGDADVDERRAAYLLRTGVAEEVKAVAPKEEIQEDPKKPKTKTSKNSSKKRRQSV